jgi:hypothetical protein
MFYFYAPEEKEKIHILQELKKIKALEEKITELNKINTNPNFANSIKIKEINDLEWEKIKLEWDLKEYKKNSMEKMKNSSDKKLKEQYKREKQIENKILEIKNGSVWVNLEFENKIRRTKEEYNEITIDKMENILKEVELYKNKYFLVKQFPLRMNLIKTLGGK